MKIEYLIDKSDGIEINNIIGNIIISDEQSKISVDNEYLDSWFCTLVIGYMYLKNGKNSEIDLLESGYEVVFEKNKDKIKITFPATIIIVNNLFLFEKELKKIISSFFKELENYLDSPLLPTLDFLNKFLNNNVELDKELPQPIIRVWDFK